MVYVLDLAAVRTGKRAGELAGLEWADVDFDRRLIMVQRSFDGPTKSGLARMRRRMERFRLCAVTVWGIQSGAT